MVNMQFEEDDLREFLKFTRLMAAFNSIGTVSPAEPNIISTTQAVAGGQRHLPVANDLRGLSQDAADAITRQWVEEVERSGAEYCRQRNLGKSGRAYDKSPQQEEIQKQVDAYKQRRIARGFVKRSS